MKREPETPERALAMIDQAVDTTAAIMRYARRGKDDPTMGADWTDAAERCSRALDELYDARNALRTVAGAAQ
jgi:hypothetical protein